MTLRVIGPPADGLKRGLPGGPADVTDSYTDKLVKLVPAEAISVYPLLKNQADVLTNQMDVLAPHNARLLVYLTAWVLLFVVILLRWSATSVDGKGAQWGAVFIAAVAFFIWVHVVGGDFGFELLVNKYLGGVGQAATDTAGATRAPGAADPISLIKSYISSLFLTAWTLVAPIVYKGDQHT